MDAKVRITAQTLPIRPGFASTKRRAFQVSAKRELGRCDLSSQRLYLLEEPMEQTIPRLLIAGTNSGCGKTTLVCGILRALHDRGVAVASFKCGPDYIDPMFHSRILDTKCRNLDLQFFPENTLRYLFAQGCQNAQLGIIEGVMGYYDGVSLSTKASSYEISKATATPTVLVVNARGAAHSLLAVISGFASLHPDSNVRGVIFNNCSSMLYPRLEEAVLSCFSGRIRPLGFLPPMPECRLESRHLGLITAGEIQDLQETMGKLAAQAEKTVKLDELLSLAASAPELSWEPVSLPRPGEPVPIAVAMDPAFCFYYEDNLRLLEHLGARLVPFSPLKDPCLPENVRGLYLGGGYPELYTKELSQNTGMLQSIRHALKEKLPCIAECGGFLYLQKTLLGKPMVGHLPGDGFDTGHLVRFGYVSLTAREDNLLCAAGETIPAHEFHYYDVDHPGSAYTARKETGREWDCGFATDTLYAGFPHFHFYAKPEMASRFLDACRKERKNHV